MGEKNRNNPIKSTNGQPAQSCAWLTVLSDWSGGHQTSDVIQNIPERNCDYHVIFSPITMM